MPIPSDDTHNSTSPGSREPPWLRGCRSDHASTVGVGPPLSLYLPSLGWRLLLIGLCATLAFLAVLAAGVALSPQALGPAGPMLRCVGLLPLVLLCVGIGAYLRWLRRSEARLREDLAVALALSCGEGQEDAEDDRDPRRDARELPRRHLSDHPPAQRQGASDARRALGHAAGPAARGSASDRHQEGL